jgi:diguanylate cyclase (GGDEF)-like protein/PAS domain S-box-containing protein
MEIVWTMAECQEFRSLMDREVMILHISLEGRILASSEAFCQFSGFLPEELVGRSLTQILHPDNLPQQYQDLWEGLAGAYGWTDEFSMVRNNNSVFWGEASVSPIKTNQGVLVGFHAVIHDITSKKRLEEIAITDELTKLYNRRHFNTIFPRELARARRAKHSVVLVMVDVDHFKRYNDTYGHPAGDVALRTIGEVFHSTMHRPDDYSFRLGGEEFSLVFSAPRDQEQKLIDSFVDRIRTEVASKAIPHSGNTDYGILTISLGLLRIVDPDAKLDAHYCSLADEALYQAKGSGRNKVVSKETGEEL